jgi:arginine utilization protein RocB
VNDYEVVCVTETNASRALELSVKLTNWQSVTGSDGEAAFAERLRVLLSEIPYFQDNPDCLFVRESHGHPARANLFALIRGSSSRTVILAGHFDTVSVTNYGSLAPLATQPDALRDALIQELEGKSELNDTEARTLADLRNGDFLPGRGLLDMKSGLAAGIVVLERIAAIGEPPGNILFCATPDEENRSRGMISLRNGLPEIARKFGLDIVGAINLDSTADETDGRDGRAVYLGSVGKFSPFAFVVGRPTHAGYAYQGISAHLIGAEIIRAIEFNDRMTDEAFGERSPAPVCLEARDVRQGYEVTTPAHVFLSFNWLTHKRSSVELLENFGDVVKEALRIALSTQFENGTRYYAGQGKQPPLSPKGNVLTYAELLDLVRARGGPRAIAALAEKESQLSTVDDQLAISRELVAAAVAEAGVEGPTVVIGFSSLHYPMVHVDQVGKQGHEFYSRVAIAAKTIEARHTTSISVKQFFAGISDMSFLGHRPDPANAIVVADNTPAVALSDRPLEGILSFPVVNIGPWGRDYHQKWERVHVPYTFGVLPDLIHESVQEVLNRE